MVKKRRNKQGKIRYQARVGNTTLGTHDTLAAANRAVSKHHLRKSTPDTMTVEQLIARYMPLWEGGKLDNGVPKRGTALRRRAEAKHLAKFFGTRPAESLGPLDAEEFRGEHGSAIITASAIFGYARSRRIVDVNHFSEFVPKPGKGRADLDPLTDAEVERFGRVTTELFGPRMGALIPFLAYTGPRPHEAFALDWPDIDWATDEIRVPEDTKTGARQALMLPPARAAIEAFRGIRGPVFETPLLARRLTKNSWSETYMKDVRKEFAKLEDGEESPRLNDARPLTLYELRHFNAHLLYVRMEVPSPIVAAHLGNSPAMVEKTYGHYKVGALDRLRDAVKRGVPNEARTSLAHGEAETA